MDQEKSWGTRRVILSGTSCLHRNCVNLPNACQNIQKSKKKNLVHKAINKLIKWQLKNTTVLVEWLDLFLLFGQRTTAFIKIHHIETVKACTNVVGTVQSGCAEVHMQHKNCKMFESKVFTPTGTQKHGKNCCMVSSRLFLHVSGTVPSTYRGASASSGKTATTV